MTIVNMHEAKTHLSRLVEQAAAGDTVIIARAGKPLVKVSAIEAPTAEQRIGFLAGAFEVPEDFDTLGAPEIAALFGVPTDAR